MGWAEGWDLTMALLQDPSSHVCAALSGMDYPLSREGFILSDLVDVTRMVNTNKRDRSRMKPYPRPVQTPDNEVTQSAKPTVDQATVRATLANLGH